MMRARARVERRARQESNARRPGVSKAWRNIVASTSRLRSRVRWGGSDARRADASAVAAGGDASTESSPGPRSKASGRPPPRWWPRSRTSSPPPHKRPSRTKTRRRVRLLSRSRRASDDGTSAWARTEKARAPKTSTRSRWLAPACARRKCVVLARLSSARPRVVRAFRRLRAKLFDDEPRRHLLTASEGTAQVATTRASAGLTV